MKSNLGKTKKEDRVNHAGEACSKKGDYSRVPNCLWEMGLSWQEREVWMFFNRVSPREHPTMEQIAKALGIRKAGVLSAIERLIVMNMLTVEGEGKWRKFHIPDPMYWNHDIPRERYNRKDDPNKPRDIGKGAYVGVAVKRSKSDEKIVPDGTKKKSFPTERKNRSRRNEKSFPTERKIVPDGTFLQAQTLAGSGVEGSLKTIQDLQDLIKTPLASFSDARSGGDGVTLKELDGALRGMYDKYANMSVIQSVVRDLCKIRSKAEVRDFLAHEASNRQGVLQWSPQHRHAWKEKLSAFFSQEEEEADDAEQSYEPTYEATGSLDDCPY